MPSPVITLLTDFGLQDGYAAAMKGVILGICPGAVLIDISHLVSAQDIRSAAFVLLSCYDYFPPGTIHLAVVDPGVGTERGAVAISAGSHFFVGPDNGIFTLALQKERVWEARSLENAKFRRMPPSTTFHGRDLFAPVAAHLACGIPFNMLGPECEPFTPAWSAPVVRSGGIEGEVIHLDRFGNSITNVSGNMLREQGPVGKWIVHTGQITISSITDAYGHAEPGEILALAGSSGFIEIAVNQGSAASHLGLRTGDRVIFELK